ncbi:hypothetical protein EXIGLDRAFT_748615 [Exidia glandulosa HHB12029]|uniref:WW domain-containing protein n=1 Tax=Exidia glandulosa HHB12029 TaxID=1314781 RepID=A0A166ARC4_EXIGL|nr:hypothetical protein EXIGLDRAFT_748615 [Exidia glandulosa HHB12029]
MGPSADYPDVDGLCDYKPVWPEEIHKSSCPTPSNLPILTWLEPETPRRLMEVPEVPFQQQWKHACHPNGRTYLYYSQPGATVIDHPQPVAAAYGNILDLALAATAALRLWKVFLSSPSLFSVSDDRDDSDRYELFLRRDDASCTVSYYFVDYVDRIVLWPQQLMMYRSYTDADHLRVILQYQFWCHFERYPCHRALPVNADRELRRLLTYQLAHAEIHADSPTPLPTAALTSLIRALRELRAENRGPDEEKDDNIYLTATVAAVWKEQFYSRMNNYWGTPYARVSQTQTLFEPLAVPGKAIDWVCRVLLFNEPASFYARMRDVFVDGTLYRARWKIFMEEGVQAEWSDNAFMATVTFAANMTFLSVGNGGGPEQDLPSLARTLSFCSTILSIGSIVMAKNLSHFHRRMQSCTAREANEYINSFTSHPESLGLFKLAILFSQPYSLLMWSLVVFLAGLLCYAFDARWTWSTSGPVAMILVAHCVLFGWSVCFFNGVGDAVGRFLPRWQWRLGRSETVPDLENGSIASDPPATDSSGRTAVTVIDTSTIRDGDNAFELDAISEKTDRGSHCRDDPSSSASVSSK